ncbi:MAG: GNAT family N-acetyltransferase, partial [Herpetosiphonaceae bacterium]|nr:GNAT family N-acetyltransferase [Herpetosiphonaceae bacterium]
TVVSVYVRAEWRGQRITDGLIELCLGWAREHGVLRARVAVITSNASAIRCYVRCGFRVYGVEPAVIFENGVYHDELLMGRQVD